MIACVCTLLVAACGNESSTHATNADAHKATQNGLMEADRSYLDTNNKYGFLAANEQHFDFKNGFLLEAGKGILQGKEAILAERNLTGIPSTVHWEPEKALGSASGDLGITWGKFNVDGGNSGLYVTVWNKDAKGEWKIVTDVAVNNPKEKPASAER